MTAPSGAPLSAAKFDIQPGEPIPDGLPARFWALQFVALVLEHNPPTNPAVIAWMHAGAELSNRVSANLEYILEGKVRRGRETSFVLRNLATGKANLDVPADAVGQVVCRDTGEELGAYQDVVDLGRWIVGVAQYASEQAGLPKNRRERRAARARLKVSA